MSLREIYDRAKAAGIPLGEWFFDTGLWWNGNRQLRTEQEAADALDRMCREAMKVMLPGCWLRFMNERHTIFPRPDYLPGGRVEQGDCISNGDSEAAAIISAIEARKARTT